MKPYGAMSDQHCHNWSQFSGVDEAGVNTRLRHILSEMVRCADETEKAGGDTIVFSGDLLHTRGSIAPEVFNPLYFTIQAILARGIRIIALPGNHDLASKETTELGNAFQSLAGLEGFEIATEAATFDTATQPKILVPWISSVDALKELIQTISYGRSDRAKADLFIHAGIDGVLSGMPDHGLTPAYLAGLGFKRVFAGHYHHHVAFEDGKVVSIGATTHQTYSDIGTKAGFLIVYPDRIQHFASHAPSFVEITGDTDPDDVPLIVDGNYVRVRSMKLTDREIGALRKELIEFGARGVSFQVERVTVSGREGAPIASPSTSLEMSVDRFIEGKEYRDLAAVKARAAAVLSEARAVSSE